MNLICDLSNGAISDYLFSRSHHYLTLNISQTATDTLIVTIEGGFLFAFYSNYVDILYRLRDVPTFGRKSRNFYTPPVFSPPPRRG